MYMVEIRLQYYYLGFILYILNVLKIYNYWVWAQNRRSKSSISMGKLFLRILNNGNKNYSKISIVN